MMLPISELLSLFTWQNHIINSQFVPQGNLQERIKMSTRNLLDSKSGSSCSGKISAKVITGDFTKLYQMDGIIGLIASCLETFDIKRWDAESGILLKPLTLAIVETELANRLTYSENERKQALSAGFGSDAKSMMLYVLKQLGMTLRDLINLQSDHGISFKHIEDYGNLTEALEAELESLECLEYALESKIITYLSDMLLFRKLQFLRELIAKQQLEKGCRSILRCYLFQLFISKPSLRFPDRILPDLPLKLPFCPGITSLSIERIAFKSFPDLAKGFPNLTDIILCDISKPELTLEAIKNIRTLKKLTILHCPFPDRFRTGTYLKNFPSLETFTATGCELTFIPSLPESLTSLDICHNSQIANISEELEVQLCKLKFLRFTELKDPNAQKKLVGAYSAIDKARSHSSSSSSLSIKP